MFENMFKKIFTIVRTAIFICFLILAFIYAVPVHNRLKHIADSSIDSLSHSLTENTGLSIQYKSLSPSILSNFVINNIILFDADKKQVVQIERAKINYSIYNILKGNLQKGITNITVDGVEIRIDDILKIVQTFKKKSDNSSFDIHNIRSFIPENIKLRNVVLVYTDKGYDANVNLREILLNNNLKKQYVSYQLDSIFSVTLNKLNRRVNGGLNVNGVLLDKIDDSYAQIKLSNVTEGDFKLSKLNFMLNYSNFNFDLQTIQSVFPFFVDLKYNLSNGDVSIDVETDRLNPISVVNLNLDRKLKNRLKNLQISTKISASANLFKRNIKYTASGNVDVPAAVIPQGAKIDFSFSGNDKNINVRQMKIDSGICEADLNAEFGFKDFTLSGMLEIPVLKLSNGNYVSTEVYFDPLERGFILFSPQVFIGEKSLTALQVSVIPAGEAFDFSLQVSDYSHASEDEPGEINIDGSFVLKEKFVESRISFSNLYIDSILEYASEFMSGKTAATLKNNTDKVKNYLAAGDVDVRSYIDKVKETLSYDVHYVMLANVKDETQAMLLSFNGNEQNIQIDQLNLIYGKQAVQANANIFRDVGSSDMFYELSLVYNSIPYHFSGSVMPEMISASGDYGIDFQFVKNRRNISGVLNFEYLPLKIGNNSFIISIDSNYSYDKDNGPVFNLTRFELEYEEANISVKPKVSFSGNVTKYGAQFTSVSYSDLYALLEGKADVQVNINDGKFDSAMIGVNVKNPLSEESINIEASAVNTAFEALSLKNIKDSLSLNVQITTNQLGLNRFTPLKNANNYLTASVNLFGSLENPYASISIEKLSVLFAADLFVAAGNVVLDDGNIKINDFNVDYSNVHVSGIEAEFELESFTGELNGNLETAIMNQSIYVPLKLKLENSVRIPGKFMPESFVASVSSDNISGSFMKKILDFSITAIYSNNSFTFFSSENLGLYGTVSKEKEFVASIKCKNHLSLYADGVINKNLFYINLNDINADVKNILSCVMLDRLFVVNKGSAKGSVSITKSLNNPEFSGSLILNNAEVLLPPVVPYKITTNNVLVNFTNNQILIEDNTYTVKNKKVNMGFEFHMNKWSLDHIDGYIKTEGKDKIPAKVNFGYFKAAGDVAVDLLLKVENKVFFLSGNVRGEKIKFDTSVSTITSVPKKAKKTMKCINVDVLLENSATFDFDPVLRCIFAPNSKLLVNVDQRDAFYSIDGLVKIKSGDISYLNRNFYIKSGSLRFVPEHLANPKITINAETRERDSKNQTVRIIFDVENQNLLDFEPKFSSIPAKSENEIRQLLGEIAVADVGSASTLGEGMINIAGSAGDYAVQSVIGRKIENKLREGLNFDIFSVRTNVIQNIVNDINDTDSNNKISNLFDNSTVYIGKYIGDSLYLDSMLQVTLDDFQTGLTFKPELGLELELPTLDFMGTKSSGAVRGAVSGDYNAVNVRNQTNLFVPSISFSWKLSF